MTQRSRRRRAGRAKALRPFWILAVLGGIALAFGIVALLRWSIFYPRDVRVVGNQRVTARRILRAAAIDPRENLWIQSTAAMAQRVESIPEISRVQIRRALPGQVTIAVSERVPFAYVRGAGRVVLVDAQLRVLPLRDGRAGLPILKSHESILATPGDRLTDPSFRHLLAALLALEAAHLPVISVRQAKFDGLAVELHRAPRILFLDRRGLEESLSVLPLLLARANRLHRKVATLDLRAPGTPVFVFSR